MARIVRLLSSLVLFSFGLNAYGQEGPLTPGIISANNVEITTDSGEVLDQRLGIGDQIFIVVKPKESKKGWYRISRTESDTTGVGWVETKFVRSFRRWEAPSEETRPSRAEQMGEKTVMAPDVEPDKAGQIGVVPFISSQSDDPVAKWAYDEFSSSITKNKKFQVAVESLRNEKVDPEAPLSIQTVITRYKLDGLFVGNLSGDSGQGRLLQIRYYGKGREGAILEKTKKLPKSGNLKEIVDSLATSCASAIPSK